MIIDIFGSLKENFVKKVRNPFFGTFTIVFLLKNWQLFYSLLFFDAADDRTTRIGIIEKYITEAGGTWWMFGYAVGCTLMVMVISYILLNLGALISNWFDAVVHPLVVKWASKWAKIVTKEKYDTLGYKYNLLDMRLEEERKRRHEIESELMNVESKLEDVERRFATYRTQQAEDERNRKKQISSVMPRTTIANKQSRAEKVAQKIYDNEEWGRHFSMLLKHINMGDKYISQNTEFDDYLLIHGLITFNGGYMELTEFGQEVEKHFLEKTV